LKLGQPLRFTIVFRLFGPLEAFDHAVPQYDSPNTVTLGSQMLRLPRISRPLDYCREPLWETLIHLIRLKRKRTGEVLSTFPVGSPNILGGFAVIRDSTLPTCWTSGVNAAQLLRGTCFKRRVALKLDTRMIF
jgi:hypothetical protein